jgi:hypothetical protein
LIWAEDIMAAVTLAGTVGALVSDAAGAALMAKNNVNELFDVEAANTELLYG